MSSIVENIILALSHYCQVTATQLKMGQRKTKSGDIQLSAQTAKILGLVKIRYRSDA